MAALTSDPPAATLPLSRHNLRQLAAPPGALRYDPPSVTATWIEVREKVRQPHPKEKSWRR